MLFAIPMFWKEGKDHIMDCYFCIISIKGINCKNKHHVEYPNVPSAIRPTHHGPYLPVLEPNGNMEYSSDFEHSDMTVVAGDDAYKPEEGDQPVPLTQYPWLDTRPEPFKKICSAAGFISQRKASVGTRNNILQVLRLWERIKRA